MHLNQTRPSISRTMPGVSGATGTGLSTGRADPHTADPLRASQNPRLIRIPAIQARGSRGPWSLPASSSPTPGYRVFR